jgi:hypothetical protein
MYPTPITIHEYRLLYPHSAAVPTLTQSGLLGLLLERQRRRADRHVQRHAMWERLRAAPRSAAVRIWRACNAHEILYSAKPIEIVTRR